MFLWEVCIVCKPQVENVNNNYLMASIKNLIITGIFGVIRSSFRAFGCGQSSTQQGEACSYYRVFIKYFDGIKIIDNNLF